MAIKISQFNNLPTVDGTIIVPVVDPSPSNTSFKTTVADLQTFILTGNAATASHLFQSVNINGVAFDGQTGITVTADASTLTNTTLNSTVVSSSLTSVGTLLNLSVTNKITGNIDTADKLKTARNINGVAFDGSADISITASLPVATDAVLGGVIIGSGISVAVDGTISVDIIPVATTTVAGTVIVGSGINVAVDGTISVETIDVATTSTAGTVIVGNGLQVEVDGTVSTTTTPTFHGFVVNANGDLEYTKMTSGDLEVANGDATEQYVMWEIGTSDYSWQITADGLLQIEYTDSDL